MLEVSGIFILVCALPMLQIILPLAMLVVFVTYKIIARITGSKNMPSDVNNELLARSEQPLMRSN